MTRESQLPSAGPGRRVNQVVQLVSQVCPSSTENAWSQRADVGVISDQVNLHLIGRPSQSWSQ